MEIMNLISGMKPTQSEEIRQSQLQRKSKNQNDLDFQSEMGQAALNAQMLGVQNQNMIQMSPTMSLVILENQVPIQNQLENGTGSILGQDTTNISNLNKNFIGNQSETSIFRALQFQPISSGVGIASFQNLRSLDSSGMFGDRSQISIQDKDMIFAGPMSENQLLIQQALQAQGQQAKGGEINLADANSNLLRSNEKNREFLNSLPKHSSLDSHFQNVDQNSNLMSQLGASQIPMEFKSDLIKAQSFDSKSATQNQLSGTEFLNALNIAKSGQGNQNQQFDFSNSQSGKENLMQFGNAREAELLKKKSGDDPFTNMDTMNSSQMMGIPPNQGGIASHSAVSVVQAPVVPGAMAQNRLSSEALIGVSGGIQNLSLKGGGEMKIHLKPEGLGELHVRVTTAGNNVGLQIQASDEKAKKILEESLTHLQESLSAHHLTLGKVDLSVGVASNQMNSNDFANDPRQFNGNSGFQGDFSQNMNQSRQNHDSQSWSGSERNFRDPMVNNRGVLGLRPTSTVVGNGRLDVKA